MEIQADKLFFRQKEKNKIQKQSRCFHYKIPEIFFLLLLFYFLFLFHLLFQSTTITVIITKHTCTNGLHT